MSTPRTVIVASLQGGSTLGDVSGNTARFTALAEEAAGNGAKILVLPQTSLTGFLSQDLETNWHVAEAGRPNPFPKGKNPAEFAEVAGTGRSCVHFAALAAKLQCYITVPFIEMAVQSDQPIAVDAAEVTVPATAGTPQYYNTVCLAAPTGEVVATYRKISPWPAVEQGWATRGSRTAFYDTPEYGRVGLAMCFDIHSVLALYAEHHIWTLLYPVAYVGNPIDWYRKDLPTLLRDVSCPCYVIGCNWATDRAMPWEGKGISTHYAPKGELLSSSNEQVGSTVVYSTLWTEDAMKQRGHTFDTLDLKNYAEWTANMGSDAKNWKW